MSPLHAALVCWFVCSLALALPTGVLRRDRPPAPDVDPSGRRERAPQRDDEGVRS